MQQLLLSWILIGVLVLPADQVGLIQALIGIPGIFIMLMGGALADRADPRNFPGWYLLNCADIPPVFDSDDCRWLVFDLERCDMGARHGFCAVLLNAGPTSNS